MNSGQVSDGRFPAMNVTFIVDVEPRWMSFSGALTSLSLVQGDRVKVLSADCLPLVTNGRRDLALYRVSGQPTHGQLMHRHGTPLTEFTQTQVCQRLSPDFINYLRQGGNVFAGFCLSVCLFVCLCVSKITRKVMDGSL